MEVYVLTYRESDDVFDVLGVFTSPDKAMKAADESGLGEDDKTYHEPWSNGHRDVGRYHWFDIDQITLDASGQSSAHGGGMADAFR